MTFVSTTAKSNDYDDEDEDMASDDGRPILGIENSGQENEDEDDDEEDGEGGAGGVGLGFGGRFGPSFQRNGQDQSAPKTSDSSTMPPSRTKFNGQHVLGTGFVPSSASEPVLRVPDTKDDMPRNKPQPSAFTSKGKVNAKSFGARMMSKMGYVQGQGLGKESQGRNVIIEANLRPQGIGLGAVKEKSQTERKEELRQAKQRGEEVVDSDEEAKKPKRLRKGPNSAANSGSSTPRRRKPKFITAEEFNATAPGLRLPKEFAPILDMTRPGGQMLTSTSGIMTPTGTKPPSSESTESIETIETRKRFKKVQADLQAFSEEWRRLEEQKAPMEIEVQELERDAKDLQSDSERVEALITMVKVRLTPNSDWSQVIACLQEAVTTGPVYPGLVDIAVAAIDPFLKDSDWNPLEEPIRYASDLKELSSLLLKSEGEGQAVARWDENNTQRDGVYRRHHETTTSYESMMYKSWLPRVLGAIREWDPLTPSPVLDIVEAWSDLLPPFVRTQAMNNVVRKLEAALSDWNPKKKRQSHHLPHTWLFPWLPHLPAYHLDPKGTGLVGDVKRKFRQLIDVWEFERGVVPGLNQWQEMLGNQWQSLIMRHVLTSMGRYLRTKFQVDPADQEPTLPVLAGVLKWRGMLGDAVIAEVLVQQVFPLWQAKLQEWMASPEADLGEVAAWYTWWRGVLLRDLGNMAELSRELDKGLHTMNVV